jgi:hypothetical protein
MTEQRYLPQDRLNETEKHRKTTFAEIFFHRMFAVLEGGA